MGPACPSQSDEGDSVQLTEREATVCGAICSSEVPLSFSELKRSTELHQEVLSRIVHRLTTHGLVWKIKGRYVGRCRQ